jgi:NADPH:quinone reductase-like Zn-dependent oxidoreductase
MGSWTDFRSVLSLVFSGEIAPIIDRVFPLTEAAAAHRRVEAADSFGKVVLTT